MTDPNLRRYNRRRDESLLAGLRMLELEHSMLNGNRISSGQFEEWYAAHRGHILNNLESFYQDRVLGGLMNYEQVKSILNEINTDTGETPSGKVIPINKDERDHLLNHLAAWQVRDNRMSKARRAGDTKKFRRLEDLYAGLSPERREAARRKLAELQSSFPEDDE